jgi:hypothetical protein
MTNLEIPKWLSGVDEEEAVELARDLLRSEAGLHGLGLDCFTISARVKTKDGGIDGLSKFPPTSGLLVPPGPQVWQMKSRSTEPSAAKEFNPEKHAPLVERIVDGDDYVLFWTYDLVGNRYDKKQKEFEDAVKELRPGAKATLLAANQIERLLWKHLGVLGRHFPGAVRGLYSVGSWGQASGFPEIEFQPDEEREHLIDAVQAHVSNADPRSPILNIVGDTGVGKSRVVYEALRLEGVDERVLVAADAETLDWQLLTEIAQSEESHLLLVVDDCDPELRSRLKRHVERGQGRIRAISIGERPHRGVNTDSRYREVLPLDRSVSRKIALSRGLDERQADFVASHAEGYPQLASELADAIRFGGEHDLLAARFQVEGVGAILEKLLPDRDEEELLGMLALFERLGFDGDASAELDTAATAFSVDRDRLRVVCERELNRLVSAAGQSRRVTPRLFALWLARTFIARREHQFADQLNELPETLQSAVISQMRAFGSDPDIQRVFGDLLRSDRFLDGTLADVDEGAARLLHVAAYVHPSAALEAIRRVVNASGAEEIRSFGSGRQLIVWALQEILWYDALYRSAADVLLTLAVDSDDETGRNIAAGAVEASFRVYLGGTGLSISERVAWARGVLNTQGAAERVPYLINALGVALSLHEWRDVHRYPGEPEPPEWKPASGADEIAARTAAWELLIEIARTREIARDRVAEVIAGVLAGATTRGLTPIIVRDLPRISWSPAARVALGSAASAAKRLSQHPQGVVDELAHLELALLGSSLADRLAYILSMPPWAFNRDPDGQEVELLRPVTEELAVAPIETLLSCVDGARGADEITVQMLFRELAIVLGDSALLDLVESTDPPLAGAVVGTFAGLAETRSPEWADEILTRWAGDSQLGAFVIAGAHKLRATDRRAELAVAAVENGHSERWRLGVLLYGAWTRPLSPAAIFVLLEALAKDPSGVEPALGIVSQWLEVPGNKPSDPLRDLAVQLVDASTKGGVGLMGNLYRALVLKSLNLDPSDELPLLLKILRTSSDNVDDRLLGRFDAVARALPEETVPAVVNFLAARDAAFPYYGLQSPALISRLALDTSPDRVAVEIVDRIDRDDWSTLLDHIEFSGTVDPVLDRLLDAAPDETFAAKAAMRFIYPGVYTGGRSAHLAGRLQVAKEYLAKTDRPGVRRWLLQLIAELERSVEETVRSEGEYEGR